MRPTYADIAMLSATRRPADPALRMPLLGLLSGLALALCLWSAVGWLVWALLG